MQFGGVKASVDIQKSLSPDLFKPGDILAINYLIMQRYDSSLRNWSRTHLANTLPGSSLSFIQTIAGQTKLGHLQPPQASSLSFHFIDVNWPPQPLVLCPYTRAHLFYTLQYEIPCRRRRSLKVYIDGCFKNAFTWCKKSRSKSKKERSENSLDQSLSCKQS